MLEQPGAHDVRGDLREDATLLRRVTSRRLRRPFCALDLLVEFGRAGRVRGLLLVVMVERGVDVGRVVVGQLVLMVIPILTRVQIQVREHN